MPVNSGGEIHALQRRAQLLLGLACPGLHVASCCISLPTRALPTRVLEPVVNTDFQEPALPAAAFKSCWDLNVSERKWSGKLSRCG